MGSEDGCAVGEAFGRLRLVGPWVEAVTSGAGEGASVTLPSFGLVGSVGLLVGRPRGVGSLVEASEVTAALVRMS